MDHVVDQLVTHLTNLIQQVNKEQKEAKGAKGKKGGKKLANTAIKPYQVGYLARSLIETQCPEA